MKETSKNEIKIGLSVLAALVILYFGIEFLKGHSPLSKHTEYYAVYDDVLGLAPTANVNLSGLKIGQVSTVELMEDQPGKVVVAFRLDKDVKLPYGTKASIEKDLLGTSSLIIELGNETKYYNSGDTIPGTLASGLMSEVSDMLPEITGVIPKIDSLITNMNNIAGNPAINNTLNNLETLTHGLNGIITNVDKATRPLPAVVNEANQLVNSLNAIAADLKLLSSNMSNLPLNETVAEVNHIATNLAQLTDGLKSNDSSLGQLINNADLYDNLRNVTANIDSLIIDIKKNPKRYISIKLL